ncbi:DUF1758 domain-containing protein [Trichonephila inaurata madagascariensis]|uniref:DUF1758 domain-containing protein n=1 Tax=Trichonephila inaurata madagascariensis TaxID=2747483 RepID=A0A8X6JFK5_9ARAC|nr:DUF1758 domain-containing protein [Trichonephila inaurata madagascariensis]GFS66477.1 DUF1758 domain-containing protein [Trichonephila inaurata madagascariensis]GFY51933.1 DUF1758 domain-containing protein [Trichonephila inaurata madagascariensis]GFY74068.1 DUF1758 domain-containing protein [Trichonephila inaurata madagascariensis]
MDALKLRRTPLRTAFTKAVNHLQEIIENDPVDMNAVETAFEQLKVKSAKLKEVEDAVLELMIESNCTQEAYNIEFEAIEGYAEKMIAWQVRVKNIMKTDALGQKDNHSLVTSSSSSLCLPKIQFQQFSGELTDWLQVSSEDRIKLARNSFDSEKFNYKKKLGNLSTTADLFNSNFKNRKDFKFKNSNDNCIFCEKMHASENCCEAASMLYDVKKNAVIKRGVCYICLKRGHMSHSCRSDVKCIICNKRHYAVLCSKLPLRSDLETKSASVENSTTASSSSSNVLANQACTSEVLLQTLVVVLKNGNHKSLVRALIDTGSQKSYILKSTAEKLAFKNEGEEEFIHSLFGGTKTKMYRHKCYKICLTNVDNNYTCNLNVYDQEMICNDVPSIRHGPWINELKNRKINLSDRGHNLGGKIEILIGADVAGKLLTGTMFYLKSGPVAIKTKLGWTLMGKTYRNKTKFDNNHFMNVTSMFVNDMCISDLRNLKDDCLSCKINCQKIEGKAITTKRSLLSIANHILDPIGFMAPVTLKPKLILQEIWKLKLKWDENFPENILNQVKQWLEQLPILAGIKIPRCLNLSSNGIKQIALHVFCDASKKAYAACVFLRVEYEENVFVKLIQAKAWVAPLKDISIPRLELLSCTLETRLAASVKNDLNLPDVRIYYLTDSMTALA